MKKIPSYVLPLLLQLLGNLFVGIGVHEQEVTKSKDLIFANSQGWLRFDRVNPAPAVRVRLTFFGFLAGLRAWLGQKFSFFVLKSRLAASGCYKKFSDTELQILQLVDTGYLNSKYGWALAVEKFGQKTLEETLNCFCFELDIVDSWSSDGDVFYESKF